MGEPKREFVSIADYLTQEEISLHKNEYHDGEILGKWLQQLV